MEDGLAETRVDLPGPLDLTLSLRPFMRWGDDLLDRWDGVRLLRTVPRGGVPGPFAFAARTEGSIDAPALVVRAAPADLGLATDAARRMFVADDGALADLASRDATVAAIAARYRGLRPALQLDVFASLVRSISAQQINLPWAARLRRALAERYGVAHHVGEERVWNLDPERLAAIDPAELRPLQFSNAKAVAVVGTARAVCEGRLALDDLAALDDEEVIERLVRLRGIGRWSAEWFLARTLARPRVVAGDLGVRKAVGFAYVDRIASEPEVRALTAHWVAGAGLAQQILLHWLTDGADRTVLPAAHTVRSS
jgi:DNA-3-methyladenine glycosylase II